MPRQERDEILDHADGPHARPAATVRNAERLVKVQVAHVATEVARGRHAHQRVHVGPVDIDAAAVAMHDLAQLRDLRFKHAVGAWIRDHHRRQSVGMLAALCLEFGEVDIALLVAAGHHDGHADHLRTGGIRAVGRGRNEADVAVALPAGPLPGPDHEQAGVFPLAPGIGLKADPGVAGRLSKPLPQLPLENRIALQLIDRREGMHVGKLGPTDRNHLARGIELHRATAERDHRAVEGEIAVGQLPQVAEHLRLAAMRVKHRVREKQALATEGVRQQRCRTPLTLHKLGNLVTIVRKQFPQPHHVGRDRRLVERDAECSRIDHPQIHAEVAGPAGKPRRLGTGVEAERVEGMPIPHRDTEPLETIGKHGRETGNAASDPPQPVGTVIDGVHGGDDGRQHLRGADVGGGLLAADVLLAGLEGEPVGGLSGGIDAHADQPPRKRSLELVAAGEERRMRPATAHRQAKPLRRADDDVGPPLTRRREQRQRERIGGNAHHPLLRMHPLGEVPPIGHVAVGGRILHERPEAIAFVEKIAHVADDQIDAQRFGPRGQHFERLRVATVIDKKDFRLRLRNPAGECHRLGCRRRLVEQRRIRNRHRGEVADHRLEIDDRFHPPLADLGLVGRVGGIPGRVLENVSLDHGRSVRAVIALADETLEQLVS